MILAKSFAIIEYNPNNSIKILIKIKVTINPVIDTIEYLKKEDNNFQKLFVEYLNVKYLCRLKFVNVPAR